MYLYTLTAAIVAIVAGILLAVCTKRKEGVIYTKLDKAGRITNILLIPLYAALGLFCMAFGIFSYPGYDGLLGILGWLIAIIVASAPLACGLALGFSVALRKKGKSKQSFAVQFLGFAGIALSLGLFAATYGNLLRHLN